MEFEVSRYVVVIIISNENKWIEYFIEIISKKKERIDFGTYYDLGTTTTVMTQIHLAGTLVFCVSLYGAELWILKAADRQRIVPFEM